MKDMTMTEKIMNGDMQAEKTCEAVFKHAHEELCVELGAALVDRDDHKFDKAWGRYWEGKIGGIINCLYDLRKIAKFYGVEIPFSPVEKEAKETLNKED